MEKAKVLLVEGDSSSAMNDEKTLIRLGYDVFSIVDSGEIAIALLKNSKPDIILMDVQVKGNMDGIEAAEIIRSQFEIPIIFMAAQSDEKRVEKTTLTMPFGYVLKPIQEDDLKVKMEMARYVGSLEEKRKIAERALKKSEENLRLFLDHSTVVTLVAIDTHIVYANKIALQKTEYTEAEILKLTIMDLTAPFEVDTTVSRWNRRDGDTNPDKTFVMAAYTKSKQIKWARVFFIKLIWEDKPAYMYFLTDITESRLAEQALKESEEKFRSVVENMTEGVVISQNMIPTYVNNIVCDVSGYSESELLGEPISKLFTEKSKLTVLDGIKKIVQGESVIYEVEVVKKNGIHIDVLLSSIPIIKNGKYEKTISILTDITPLKQNERLLELKVKERTKELTIAIEEAEQANKLKSEFMGNISHELRTPMHAILSYSQFGVEKFDKKNSETLIGFFKNINISGNRLLNLLNDLLDLSKLQTDNVQYEKDYWNIKSVFDNLIVEYDLFAMEKSITWKVQDINSVTVMFDLNKIGQVVSNLYANATRYADVNSVINISFETLTDRFIATVMNDGVSIPADELELIFDPFIQGSKTKTGAGGTGLGLPICKKIVEDHGGKIWAEYNPTGATFKFYLPTKTN